MMKNLLYTICLLFILASFNAKSQSLELIRGDEIVSGTLTSELVSYGDVKNISNHKVTIYIKIETISLVDGHTLSPCFNFECRQFFPPVTIYDRPDEVFSLEPGESTTAENGLELFVHLYPNGKFGTSKVKFYFMVNEDDYVAYECSYNVGATSVLELTTQSSVSVFPNPANDYINISLPSISDLSGLDIEVYNSHANRIDNANYQINGDVLTLKTRDFSAGVYYYIISRQKNIVNKGTFSISR